MLSFRNFSFRSLYALLRKLYFRSTYALLQKPFIQVNCTYSTSKTSNSGLHMLSFKVTKLNTKMLQEGFGGMRGGGFKLGARTILSKKPPNKIRNPPNPRLCQLCSDLVSYGLSSTTTYFRFPPCCVPWSPVLISPPPPSGSRGLLPTTRLTCSNPRVRQRP
jgi:hypothetical protein